jgi:hypothetical protein
VKIGDFDLGEAGTRKLNKSAFYAGKYNKPVFCYDMNR